MSMKQNEPAASECGACRRMLEAGTSAASVARNHAINGHAGYPPYATEPADPAKLPGEWTTNIQWKGTDICMDLNCPSCGEFTHFDGFFAHHVRCSACRAVFRMPTDVPLVLVVEYIDSALEGRGDEEEQSI